MSCYVIILNYKNWSDTVECVDSVLQSNYSDYKIIVCDNYSNNASLNMISNWLEGSMSIDDCCSNLFLKKHIKKFPQYLVWHTPMQKKYNSKILLVQNIENRGFAAGMNVGLKIASFQDDFDYAFILNNDTVVDENAIGNAIGHIKRNRAIGICSTNVKYYYPPYSSGWELKYFDPFYGDEIPCSMIPKGKIAKYTGMAFFITKDFLNEIGFMREDYFLYFEELDWVQRSYKKFSQTISLDSIVYHKEGRATDCMSNLAKFCLLRSRFLFMSKYYKKYLFLMYPRWIVRAIRKFRTGECEEGMMILKFLFCFLIKGKAYKKYF